MARRPRCWSYASVSENVFRCWMLAAGTPIAAPGDES